MRSRNNVKIESLESAAAVRPTHLPQTRSRPCPLDVFWACNRRRGPAGSCSPVGVLGAAAALAAAALGVAGAAVAVAAVVDAEFAARRLVALHMQPWCEELVR